MAIKFIVSSTCICVACVIRGVPAKARSDCFTIPLLRGVLRELGTVANLNWVVKQALPSFLYWFWYTINEYFMPLSYSYHHVSYDICLCCFTDNICRHQRPAMAAVVVASRSYNGTLSLKEVIPHPGGNSPFGSRRVNYGNVMRMIFMWKA